jgi:nucleoside phosphorylase/GTPase SAR1 family protein/WD40 repeat protein
MPTASQMLLPNTKASSEFESICKDILNVKCGLTFDSEFAKYGRSGQTQKGIDLYAQHRDGLIVAQCKNYTTSTTKKKLITKIQTDIASIAERGDVKSVFILTAHRTDKDIQETIIELNKKHKKQFNIKGMYWDDIEEIIWNNSFLLLRHFPEYYRSPQWGSKKASSKTFENSNIPDSQIKKLFLLITANKNETAALLNCGNNFFKFTPNQQSTLPHDANFYNIGKFGCYDVIHLELIDQASAKAGASILSISTAIDAFHPDAVILVGVAFGAGDGKNDWQLIGDVLISKTVTDYESGVIQNGNILSDGATAEAGKFLISTFNAFSRTWNFTLHKRSAKYFMGNILSGDKYVDDKNFKSQLFIRYPLAYGGEMEGRGAYAACRDKGLNEWIIVKGICDWGDGDTCKNKQENQKIAAEAAISLLMHVFSDASAFKKLPKNQNYCLIAPSDENTEQNQSGFESVDSYSKRMIWEANKEEYVASQRKGNRFANLNILSSLLPQGHVVTSDFTEYGKLNEKDIMPLQDIIDTHTNENISIIGEGGIGKTTFLLRLTEKIYGAEYNNQKPVPLFIELNRCPAQIGEWYSSKKNKCNFITRYIAAQLAVCEIEDVPNNALTFVEKELSKTRQHKLPEYVLLLDGFNEVNCGTAVDKHGKSVGSIRELLNNEIKTLMNYENVQIITTSRKMDMAYFSGMTKNIELIGIRSEDITNYLRKNQYNDIDIRSIESSRSLMECLKIPLFLCMFTASGNRNEDKPVTRGEILYHFFNRPHSMYNEKLNAERINVLSSMNKRQVSFILDFILPYIGWCMESKDDFSWSKETICSMINEFFFTKYKDHSLWNKSVIAFPEYESENHSLKDTKKELEQLGCGGVLDCIVNTLGIMYHNKQFKYSFLHHHIRDYFASIHEIQLMKMAVALRDEYVAGNSKNHALIDDAYNMLTDMNIKNWNETKMTFIGEIVCEHKNTPILTEDKWTLPPIKNIDQQLLKSVLDVFRLSNSVATKGIFNVVETMKRVRVNLAGENFSSLDLRQCRFHETTCSIGRNDNRLAANFQNSIVSDDTFNVEGHYGDILEFTYSKSGDFLFTLSDDGTIKKWEVETGKCLNTIQVLDWGQFEDEKIHEHFILSSDEEHFLIRGYTKLDDATRNRYCFVQEFSFADKTRTIYVNSRIPSFSSMRYSADSKFISATYAPSDGENYLYIYKRGNPEHIYGEKIGVLGSLMTSVMLNEENVLLISYYARSFDNTADYEFVTQCQIALFNIPNCDMEILYQFKSEIDVGYRFFPMICTNNKGNKVAFFEEKCVKEFNTISREIKNASYNYVDVSAIYMNYMNENDNFIMITYKDSVVIFNLKDGHETAIYQQEDYNFLIRGNSCGKKLLMFDDMSIPYELNTDKNTIPRQPKYKHNEMLINGIHINKSETEILLCFDNDSAIMLDVKTGKLTNTIFYGERDIKLGLALFDKARDCLIILLENDSYEYVKYYDIPSCFCKRTYFDFKEKQKLRSMETAETADRLLCIFDRKVSEIDLKTLSQSDVYVASNEETIFSAKYLNDSRLVQIVLSKNISDSEFVSVSFGKKSRNKQAIAGIPFICEFSEISNGHYKKVAEYKLPQIPSELLSYFVPGTSGRYSIDNGSGSINMYVTSGIFVGWTDALNRFLAVEKRVWIENGEEKTINATLKVNENNFFCYDQSFIFDNKTLLNISDDLTLIVVLDGKRLTLHKFDGQRYSEIASYLLDNECIENCTINNKKTLFCVAENSSVFSVDLETGYKDESLYEPSLIPGLVIMGCDFRGSEMSDYVRNVLVLHGGIV